MALKSASPDAAQILGEAGLEKLPSDWDIIRIEDLLSEDRGIAVGVMYPGNHDPEGVPLIKAGDLSGNHINPQPEFRITKGKHFEYRRTELMGGELLLSLVGEVGRCAIVPMQMSGWNAARAIAVLRFADPDCASFARLCLLSAPIQHIMQVWSTTTVQATLNLKEIRQIPLPWPPKKQRQAITHILGTLDDKIELNRRINETLEAMVRAIFKSWFIDFDPVRAKIEGRSTGFDSKTTALFPSSFQNSEFGKIPSGWRIGFLGDLAINMRKGIQVKDIEGNTPYIGLEHMPRRCIALSEWGFADNLESNKYQFCRGEILFGKLRPYFHKVGVAPTDGVCSTDILVIAPKSAELFGLVLGHLSSVELINYADAGSTGTKMPRTNWQELSRYILVIPPERLAASFTKLMSPMIGRITSAIHESKIIIETRDALLPKLLSGEILAKDAEKMARTVV